VSRNISSSRAVCQGSAYWRLRKSDALCLTQQSVTSREHRAARRWKRVPSSDIYTRVSSHKQQQEGFSLGAQSKLLYEYADLNGFRMLHT
jgi:hypothetical protein